MRRRFRRLFGVERGSPISVGADFCHATAPLHSLSSARRNGAAAAMALSPDLVSRVDAVFAGMDKPGHPGAALLVVEHDEVVYRRCFGLADLEAQRPVTADTSFYLGSISKQFAAMAIMLLAEEGKLAYED